MCKRVTAVPFGFAVVLFFSSLAVGQQDVDPYRHYVQHSRDFQRVHQDRQWALQAFPSWTYMPWTYRWTIGFDDAAGRWSREHGYNGGFVDRDDIGTAGSPRGRLQWLEKFRLPFYMDHAAGKGLLHLFDGGEVKPHLDALHSTGIRTVPMNQQTLTQLRDRMRKHITAVRDSPQRVAYALDDEASWGHFVHPTMWQITDDPAAYQDWLTEIYGEANAPKRTEWISYDTLLPHLRETSIAEFDASPLMDQWTFNDSWWSNQIGELIQYSNTLDPATPCGLVGGQMPSPFGGYDYAKLMRKVQFIESYNLGSSQAIIRSLNPENGLPAVTTHFHRSVDDTIWQTWYYLAHGNRGFIGWVDGWFDGETPKPWHREVAPSYREAGDTIGPLLAGSRWQHDRVAIYYSHASTQLGWILDAEAHGKTWRNRNNDHRLSSAANVRKAWENMLRDSGLQYDFISYVDAIQQGIPDEYDVLILPACLALSDAEADAIRAFCKRGGTVIADYLPGMWDQHGTGRSEGGALDDMFGIEQPSSLAAKSIFGESLWVEVDQDANYSYKTATDFLTNKNTCQVDESGFHRAIRDFPTGQTARFGEGQAWLMNLSPQWYNAYREQGMQTAAKRDRFMQPIFDAGVRPWVRIADESEQTFGYEITYWRIPTDDGQPPRTLLFVCFNPDVSGNSQGGGNSVGLKSSELEITLQFATAVTQVRNERTGTMFQNGRRVTVPWKQNEAVVLSLQTNAK
ncbi:beta-galactosidase trimerization domain-containing protein [Rosistilla oblonga]|uniref:beta-galactosidase trimerization domain-containing protein n=1 Tax=Rosistilla oblonga TaxID=2527990 RepID=UPI003A986AF9